MADFETPAILSYLKVRHLYLLDLLAKHETLRRAAVHMHMSQPAAAGMLNDIETLFGFPLFTRSRRGVTLTAAGAGLLGSVRTLLNEFEALQQHVVVARTGGARTVRVGAVPHVFAWLLPAIAKRIQAARNVTVTAVDGNSSALLDLLLVGKLDCVLGRVTPEWFLSEVRSPLHFERLYEEDVVFVAGIDNPILTKPRLDYQDLVSEEWALPGRASTTRITFVEAFLRNGLTPPDPKVESNSFISNLTIAATSSMLSLVPRIGTIQHQKRGLIGLLDLRVDGRPMAVNLVTRKSAADDPVLSAVVEDIRCAVSQDVLSGVEG